MSVNWLLLLNEVLGIRNRIYSLLLDGFDLGSTIILRDCHVLDHFDVASEEKFILRMDLDQLLDHIQRFLSELIPEII